LPYNDNHRIPFPLFLPQKNALLFFHGFQENFLPVENNKNILIDQGDLIEDWFGKKQIRFIGYGLGKCIQLFGEAYWLEKGLLFSVTLYPCILNRRKYGNPFIQGEGILRD
jgi:hypothetical protein